MLESSRTPSRTGNRVRLVSLLALVACFLSGCATLRGTPFLARPRLQRSNRASSAIERARAAGRALDVPFWTEPASEAVGTVVVDIYPTYQWITVGFPAGSSPPAARNSFVALARSMGWTLPHKASVSGQVGTTSYFIAYQWSNHPSEASPRRRFDFVPIQEALQISGAEPLLIAVSLHGVRATSSTWPTAFRGSYKRAEWLFYPPDSSLRKRSLELSVGPPLRSLLAVGSIVVLWLLAPGIAQWVARRQALLAKEVQPVDRLRTYRAWRRAIAYIVLFGAPASGLFVLLLQLYIWSKSWVAALLLGLIVLPLAYTALLGRLLGLSLERAALAARRDLPWYRLAVPETFAFVGALGVVATVYLSLTQVITLALPDYLAGLAIIIALKVFFWHAWAVLLWRQWRNRARQFPPTDPTIARVEELVREITTRAGDPLATVRLLPPAIPNRRVANAGVTSDVGYVQQEFLSSGTSEEAAALIAAQWLARPRTARDRLGVNTWTLTVVSAACPAALAALLYSEMNPKVFVWLVVAVVSLVLHRLRFARSVLRLQKSADLRTVEAQGTSYHFLSALRRLEEILALELSDKALSREAAYARAFARRRLQLEKQLGIE